MRFGILGPLEVIGPDGPVTIAAPKQRALLALLLLRANTPVSVDSLIDQLWGTDPPRTARVTLHNHIRRLRQALQPDAATRAAAPLVVTTPDGYLLRVPAGALDLDQVRDLVAAADEAAQAGAPEHAVRCLRRALGSWRGPVLAGIDAEALRYREVPRLEELRLAAVESCIEAELACGRHREVAGELTALVAEHPLRERLHELLMLALHRSGRPADALVVYRDLRRRLVEDLGIEPMASLRSLERRILADDPTLGRPAVAGRDGDDRPTGAPPAPRQLPPDVIGFTGRAKELARLRRALERAGQAGSVVVCSIQGSAGVGKSALAVHAGYRAAGRFPDGQLYVNLHGSTAGMRPLASLEVLGRLLRSLGVAGDRIPAALDEAAAQFRTVAATRRLLVVLDNAADAAQVAPLLPGGSGSAVLVTSRGGLGLVGSAVQLQLDVLPPGEAVELLGRSAGPARLAAEPEAAESVARSCGRLPLALRIAGARLAARPSWPVAALAERLADTRRRLDELDLPQGGVRASFDVSYRQLCDSPSRLDRAAAATFPLLGMVDGPDLSVAAAARLVDEPPEWCERLLERLADAHLLEASTPGRYGMHDLLRLYAREHAAQAYPEPARAAALTRVLVGYTATAWATFKLLRPSDRRLDSRGGPPEAAGLEFGDAGSALAWLDAERANLVAAVTQAAATPLVPDTLAIQLAQALFGFFQARGHLADQAHVNEVAVEVAGRAGDQAARAQAHNDLGVAYDRLGNVPQARAQYEQALALRRELGDRRGEAGTLSNFAAQYVQQGRLREGAEILRRSLAISRAVGDRSGELRALLNLGHVLLKQGANHQALTSFQETLAIFQETLAICRELGDRHGEAGVLCNLGIAYHRHGRYDEALASLREGLVRCQEVGERYYEAEALCNLGIVDRLQGRHGDAVAHQQRSRAIYRELGDPLGEGEALRELSTTMRDLGREAEARAYADRALAILGDPHAPEPPGTTSP